MYGIENPMYSNRDADTEPKIVGTCDESKELIYQGDEVYYLEHTEKYVLADNMVDYVKKHMIDEVIDMFNDDWDESVDQFIIVSFEKEIAE
jgi:hypothetical protein